VRPQSTDYKTPLLVNRGCLEPLQTTTEPLDSPHRELLTSSHRRERPREAATFNSPISGHDHFPLGYLEINGRRLSDRSLEPGAHGRFASGRFLAWRHEDYVVGELPHQGIRIVCEPRLQESLATLINRLLTHVFPL
jgi:hypothetical protein